VPPFAEAPAVTGDAARVMGVVVAALILFVTDLVTVDLVGLFVILALVFLGVLDPTQAFAGFGNQALITIACMFALSAGLIRVGALDALIRGMFGVAKGSKARLTVALLLAVAVSSAFLNNTPIAVIFLPVVLGVCTKLQIAPSRLLIPMSYASILGGTCTLIGTSTNLLVKEAADSMGHPPIGVFEFSIPGILFALCGFAYLATIGRWLLPRRATVTGTLAEGRIREFVTEIYFPDGSPLIGASYQEILAKAGSITPLMLIRGEEVVMGPLVADRRAQFVRAGDVVLLKGDPGSINAILDREGVSLPPELGQLLSSTSNSGRRIGRTVTMAELVVNPNSPLIGRTLAGADFSRRHGGVGVLAILRRDEHLRERLARIRLRLGDTLLVVCDEAQLRALRDTDEFILLEGVEERVVRRDKAPLATSIMAAVVILAAFEVAPISVLAMSGVGAMVVFGVLPLRQAYAAVDFSLIVMIAGLLALGRAMHVTGLIEAIALRVCETLSGHGPEFVIAGMYGLSALLTAIVSNNVVAVLLTPVAFQVAANLGLQPEPFLFAVLFGASASFATPMGYQTNLFVYGPGAYRFTDYLRVGAPLSLLLLVVAYFLIPWYWPLEVAS